jgi:hypothetical protein
MKKSIFDGFEQFQIKDCRTVEGGKDTGTTQFIETTYGVSGLDNYADPVRNDGTKSDWSDNDACK